MSPVGFSVFLNVLKYRIDDIFSTMLFQINLPRIPSQREVIFLKSI
jgi:hypothetical protein